MPDDVRSAIERAAFTHGRTVTAEINLRLRSSLEEEGKRGAAYPAAQHVQALTTAEHDSANGVVLSATDHAMLDVFHRLPPEKQLALLSLFR